MEFIHGAHIDELDKIKQLGVNPKDIGKVICQISY
jgi:predicted unusual protein kinase regulating ubiquinone biosynthesis (AarF/ABC1/UbiB family)